MPGAKRECRSCQKVMRSDNLKIHQKICKGRNDLLPNYMNKEVSAQQPKNLVASKKVSLQDIEDPPTFPTFDGGEFSGEKPLSERTLLKIMDMLKIPHENRAQILKEELELDKKVWKR